MMMARTSTRPWSSWDEVQETAENKVIKGAYEENIGYFDPKIDNILKQTCLLGNKFESAFIKLIIDDQWDNKPLEYVKQYIIKNREKADILIDIANDFKGFFLNLVERSVESENCDSLQNILNWFENEVLEQEDMRRLTFLWEQCSESHSNIDYHIKRNNLAMIRACEKNNFEMVLHFFKFGYFIDKESMMKMTPVQNSACSLLCRNYEKLGNDVLFHFRQLHATSKPAFMIAQFRTKLDQEFLEFDDEFLLFLSTFVDFI